YEFQVDLSVCNSECFSDSYAPPLRHSRSLAHVLDSHIRPVLPGGKMHSTDPCLLTHVDPEAHGDRAHWSMMSTKIRSDRTSVRSARRKRNFIILKIL
ncbi:hypothetical protein PENTCL1PPCAC_12638, partial [Pristionchus entomophagus]